MGGASWAGAAPQLPLCLAAVDDGGLLREPGDPVLLERSAAGSPLLLASDDSVELPQGDFAFVPVALPDRAENFPDGQVLPNGAAAVVAAPGPWIGGKTQLVLVGNEGHPRK